MKFIPLLSWNDAVNYERHILDLNSKTIPTLYDVDDKSFAVRVETNTADRRFQEGDVAIVSPSVPIQNEDFCLLTMDHKKPVLLKKQREDSRFYYFKTSDKFYNVFQLNRANLAANLIGKIIGMVPKL